MAKNKAKIADDVSNGAEGGISTGEPYLVEFEIEGVSDILFHAWDSDAVEAKGKAPKGSQEKKSDNVESYVVRNKHKEIVLPATYMRAAIVESARFEQDPRSPRKCFRDLAKASFIVESDASLGKDEWDYLHRCRVVIQRNAVPRQRPAFHVGWTATFTIQVILAEYLPERLLRKLIDNCGKLVGIGDYRPTYGRFVVKNWKRL